jgi:hypothetical protein
MLYVYGPVSHIKALWAIWAGLAHITNYRLCRGSMTGPTYWHGMAHNWGYVFVGRAFVSRAFVSLCRVVSGRLTCTSIVTVDLSTTSPPSYTPRLTAKEYNIYND